VGDPWLTENQTACKIPKKETTEMVKHASNRRMLKEATLSTQDYRRMKKQKLIEICRAKGITGANKKKTKKELAAKLGAVA
jgi:Na+-translocating ferredoxin:NAD+ oxidoreductase RnfC subunit